MCEICVFILIGLFGVPLSHVPTGGTAGTFGTNLYDFGTLSLLLGRGTDIYQDKSEFIHENCDNALVFR